MLGSHRDAYIRNASPMRFEGGFPTDLMAIMVLQYRSMPNSAISSAHHPLVTCLSCRWLSDPLHHEMSSLPLREQLFDKFTLDGLASTFDAIASMHLLVMPSSSDQDGKDLVLWRVTIESLHPLSMQELKKTSILYIKFPFSASSVIWRYSAAHLADTML